MRILDLFCGAHQRALNGINQMQTPVCPDEVEPTDEKETDDGKDDHC